MGSLPHGPCGVHPGPILVPRDAGPGGGPGEVPSGWGRRGEAVCVAEPRQESRAAPESEHLDSRELFCKGVLAFVEVLMSGETLAGSTTFLTDYGEAGSMLPSVAGPG